MHGGDHGPAVVLSAALNFLEHYSDVHLCLFGDAKQMTSWLSAFAQYQARITWYDGQHYPHHDTSLRELLRTPKSDDALAMALRSANNVVDQTCAAVVTAADTRVLMIRARQCLGYRPGIKRPALGAWIPGYTGPVLALDVGASVVADADDMLASALMGHRFLKAHQYERAPRIGLLNIGHEAHKASQRLATAHQLFGQQADLDYRGYVEPKAVFANEVDMVITDGFTGNVMLKSMEATADYVKHRVFDVLTERWYGRMLGLLTARLFAADFANVSAERHNGAPLLGVNGWVVKSHGNANAEAFGQALQQARHAVRLGVPERMWVG